MPCWGPSPNQGHGAIHGGGGGRRGSVFEETSQLVGRTTTFQLEETLPGRLRTFSSAYRFKAVYASQACIRMVSVCRKETCNIEATLIDAVVHSQR